MFEIRGGGIGGTVVATNGHALRAELLRDDGWWRARALFHEGFLPQATCRYGRLPAVKAWLLAPCGVATRRCDALWTKSQGDDVMPFGRNTVGCIHD